MQPDFADSKEGRAVELKPGRYRHFKGGEYAVQGIATHSETGEQLVVYTPLYGEGGLWVRPLSMFLETVDRDDEEIPRFTYIDR
jgi:cyclomaltodextrinase